MPKPMLLTLGGPVFVIYLVCTLWLLLVAAGVVSHEGVNSGTMEPAAALFTALACALISLTGWAVHKDRLWSRPLLLWLPFLLAASIAGIAYSSNVSVTGVLLGYVPTSVIGVVLFYWYLYRKENVVAYYRRAD